MKDYHHTAINSFAIKTQPRHFAADNSSSRRSCVHLRVGISVSVLTNPKCMGSFLDIPPSLFADTVVDCGGGGELWIASWCIVKCRLWDRR